MFYRALITKCKNQIRKIVDIKAVSILDEENSSTKY